MRKSARADALLIYVTISCLPGLICSHVFSQPFSAVGIAVALPDIFLFLLEI